MNHTLSGTCHSIKNQNLELVFGDNHTLRQIKAFTTQVNLYEPSEFEAALSNVYLRTKQAGVIAYTPLIGDRDISQSFVTKQGVIGWETKTDTFTARTTWSLADSSERVYLSVEVNNIGGEALVYDLVYGQDLALADEGGVKSNECYMSQYLDHQVFQHQELGYVVCSRQNLPQSTGNPASQIGCLTDKVIGFSTDGYQFFGKGYRFEPKAEVLSQANLANERLQFEMGYIALQTEELSLARKDVRNTVFYIDLHANLTGSNVSELRDIAPIAKAYLQPESDIAHYETGYEFPLDARKVLVGETLSEQDLDNMFGTARRFTENDNETLLSFFYGDDSRYVTLAAKERLLERSTGHMISSGNNQSFRNAILSSTHGMYGVFNSHVVLGNTSFNKLLGVERTSLNLFKFSGQRIWVKVDGEYKILTMPSAYEVGLNHSRWFYKMADGCIQVTSFSAHDKPSIQLDIELINLDQSIEVIVTNQLLMGNNENDSQVSIVMDSNDVVVTGQNDLVSSVYPELSYRFRGSRAFDDSWIIGTEDSARYLVFKGVVDKRAYITIAGTFDSQSPDTAWLNDSDEITAYVASQKSLLNQFHVEFEHDPQNAQKLNDTMQWFTHNALVHYSTPHGLEQYSGAAWGTRDVSQGPFEFFMSMQKYDHVIDLLTTIYSHQHIETGTWPQWFMFDQYSKIQQEECHGDIVVWPLKALADYITITGDISILDRKMPYTSIENGFAYTEKEFTLLAHVERQIQHIVDNLVPGTSLSCYGDGDWDDTLQPANQALRENMVSGWTIPLTLQAMKTFTAALKTYTQFASLVDQVETLTVAMETDYHRLLVKDGVLAGFIHLPEKDITRTEYLLHPLDQKTGIRYRLLPASRSIISETFDKAMADSHMAIIEEHLVHPDGVRLMEKMAQYNGGKQSYFKRAELAANLGREVGLQYCHAHIRFIEALCKMGKAEQVQQNLYKIVPVGIQQAVPNAEIRQSNAYFSSSDGKFNDRYEAYDNFDKLKRGDVAVKGGWRIYSSGPGIYINQVISNVLGIRFDHDNLVLDPILDKALGKVTVTFAVWGKPCEITYVTETATHSPKRITVNGVEVACDVMANRYRTGGVCVEKQALLANLNDDCNQLMVWL